MTLKLITDVTAEQVTLEQARKHCQITPEGSPPVHDDDALLSDILIPAAREWAEDFTGLAMAPKTYELVLDAFPEGGDIELKVGPVTAIESITYVDEDGAEQTVDSAAYTLDETSTPQWVMPAVDTEWPATLEAANVVRVRFRAGFSLPDESPVVIALPKKAMIAMLLVIVHLYENRGVAVDRALAEVPMGPKSWLSQMRVRRGWA